MKRNEGFTLVELLVAMVVGSIVTLAATSVLLLGLRYNAISIGAAQRQNTTRIIMSLLEGVASEGTITEVDSRLDGWAVHGQPEGEQTKGPIILQYIAEDHIICTSDTNNPLLEGVIASQITLSDTGLLTVSVETEDGSYVSSIHCRTAEKENPVKPTLPNDYNFPTDPTTDTDKFINALLSQYPENGMPNPGVILDENGVSTGKYYATWYAEESPNVTDTVGWNSGTPWCACYISWALRQVYSTAPIYANVDTFMASFGEGNWTETDPSNPVTPAEGDIVFFDWEGGNDPEHVGVVLLTNGGFIYTIEGNSAGLVAMRMYSTSDPAIIGYGSLEAAFNQSLEWQIYNAIKSMRGDQIEYDFALQTQAMKYAKGEEEIPESYTFGLVSWSTTIRDQIVSSWTQVHTNHSTILSSSYTRCGIGVHVTETGVDIVVILDGTF